ncbi:ABC transporter permease [Truepera radiovictrix]|uniref:Binding-protein-dependent transport systems inner membrane component n=1 Tax=Truepera radiovictrix (strain DSM 17093 / CIP 108686 / LMG 22925 / RQ-24) TaxID=649638 RepID=D7CUT3_TRURR|nr:ABC transporter permease [Truepera radiovictrix]ADI14074.1 binding-protein-dependent transport systems inner membrane component [Truepera radiovictrix DSM 17093]WMT57364.1 ABC transporter permease [Truepera radiovictrix]
MGVFIVRRILQMIPVLFGVTLIIFFLVRVSGDPVTLLLPEDAPPEQVAQLRESLGLDRPLPEQYARFLRDLLRGDFGTSIRYRGQAALPVVLERLPATLELAAASILVAVLISLPLGILAATRRGRLPDYGATSFAVLGQAMPNFWLGIMLILVFGVHLRWFPVSGRGTTAHLVLPALTLGTALAALLMRLLRSTMLEVLSQDFVRTARAKGLRERVVLFKHAIRNALIAYVTVLGLQVATLMAGAVVTEQVFAWPGIGLLAIQAINIRDMAVVQTVVIVVALIVMVANLLVDLLYALIDPRIQYA